MIAVDQTNVFHLAQQYLSNPAELRGHVEDFFEAAELVVMESRQLDSKVSAESLIPAARSFFDIAYAINRTIGPVIDVSTVRRFVVDPTDINALHEFVVEIAAFETYQVADKSLIIDGATAQLDWSKVPAAEDIGTVARVFQELVMASNGQKPKQRELKKHCKLRNDKFCFAKKALDSNEIVIPIEVVDSKVKWGDPFTREKVVHEQPEP